MNVSDCLEVRGHVPITIFWIGIVIMAAVVKQTHGLTIVQTLRIMLGLRVKAVVLREWVFWAGLGLLFGVIGTWVILIQGCPVA